MPDPGEPIAEEILLPEPFPYAAELAVAEHVLRQALKEDRWTKALLTRSPPPT